MGTHRRYTPKIHDIRFLSHTLVPSTLLRYSPTLESTNYLGYADECRSVVLLHEVRK
jgi:hypothetical protein